MNTIYQDEKGDVVGWIIVLSVIMIMGAFFFQSLKPKMNNTTTDTTANVDSALGDLSYTSNPSQSSGSSTNVPSVMSFKNEIAYSSSFKGQYGTISGGNTAEGGHITETATSYFWAKKRYIDLGKYLNKKNIQTVKFRANTGGGDKTYRDIDIFVSSDGEKWHKVAIISATSSPWGATTIQGATLPIEDVRYLKAENSFCLDNFTADFTVLF